MIKFAFAILAAGTAGIIAFTPAPAAAQGTTGPVFRDNTSCPTGWRNSYAGEDIKLCYPRGTSATKPIYLNRNKKPCAPGYGQEGAWCVEGVKSKTASSDEQDSSDSSESSGSSSEGDGSAADRLVSYATLPKANRLDRCPLGYFSKDDMTTCTTRLSPAPQSRPKTGPCKSGEIDEWGLYCTANATVITRDQAEMEATRDFNNIYTQNMAQPPTQTPSGDDVDNAPPMVAAYGPRPARGSSASSASSSQASDQTAQCTTDSGSATGAAIGGALGGDAGAALGGMLGGLGKKKKKKTC